MKKLIIKTKVSGTKQLYFRETLEALIAEGYDISLQEGQTEIAFYLPEAMLSVVLNINGTWKRE
jgi:hypothetical protein